MNQPHVDQELLHAFRQRVDPRIRGLLQRSSEAGFLGGMSLTHQVDHSLGFVWSVEARMGERPQAVLDLGSGGGIPGLVLASCWPDADLVLLDSNTRRVEFLDGAIVELGLGRRVTTRLARAEEAGREDDLREHFSVVAARSFGPPGVTAECSAPLLALGGILVVSEPPEGAEAARWPAEGLATLGLSAPDGPVRFLDRYGYQVISKDEVTDERYPRRVGVPTKRPLF